MAHKAFVTDLKTVPEAHRTLYKEIEGGFVLDVETADGWELANTHGLKTALQTERQNAKDAKKSLEGFGSITPQQAKDAIKKVEEFGKLDVDGQVAAKVKEREAQLIAAHDAEKAKLNEILAKRAETVHRLTVEAAADAALVKVGANPHLLRHVVLQHLKLVEDGDNFRVQVVDSAGVEQISGTKGGVAVPMTPEGLVETLRKDDRYAPAFPAKQGGSGGDGGGRKTGGSQKVDLANMSPAQKLEAGRQARMEKTG